MKKLLVPIFAILIFFACEKEETHEFSQEETTSEANIGIRGAHKVDVCHNGKITSVSIKSLPGHQQHGDAVDMDGDGYFDIDNLCSETDCDDTDPDVNVTECMASIYDNESLTIGDLNGQDGWVTKGWINDTPASFTTEVANTVNGGLGLASNAAGSGIGTSGSRLEDENWQLPNHNACDGEAYLEFEATISMFGVMVGPGYDSDNDGEIDIFRGNNQETPVYFWLSAASSPIWGLKIVPSGGYNAATTVPVSLIGALGDHVRIKVLIDYQANGGFGSASAFYQNLTNGDSTYEAIPGLQNVPLTLDFNATDHNNPSLWNGMTYHFEGIGNQLDNMTFSNCN